MHVSSSNSRYLFLPQRSSTQSNDSSTNYDQDALAGAPPTQQELRTGFFGSSRARLDSVAATGGYVINELSYLTASDIDLIKRTTGVTVKDGGYYDSDGNRLGMHSDSHGNLLDPHPGQTKAAEDLAFSLSELRMSGGMQGDASLKHGRKITTDDLEIYLKGYAAAKASGQNNIYVPDADAIKEAEKILASDQI
ncbi:hypothetical protein [Methylosinus sp. Sm6]|uniref:hypothetical protein n=1 Tax=Methylosinus sp. Sm6 TaxID=2866948 RepID=UPI001C98F5EB|nr:hypothetical protein [Methylosinus sp. Sm6]MBY6240559.1 hypothetical protein [Methylosinus sp. Sm6]